MTASYRDPSSAMLMAALYQNLGGRFGIDQQGRRFTYRFEHEACGRDNDRERVAVMLEGLLESLHADDRAMVFAAYAEVAVDPDTITATFDEPTRRAA